MGLGFMMLFLVFFAVLFKELVFLLIFFVRELMFTFLEHFAVVDKFDDYRQY